MDQSGSILRFKALLTDKGWISNAEVKLDADGKILSVGQGTQGDLIDGFALPGFQNAHSHAFQYAMAGLAEFHGDTAIDDDFWSWRTAMYDLALSISPDQLEDIAAMLYSEMLRHGYTSVAEFHYLHHDQKGEKYANRAEMGERLVAAARKAGIGITLIPMFYQTGGFGMEPLEKQRRFISGTLEDYYRLLAKSAKATSLYKHARIGTGIHSIRAVKAEDIQRMGKDFSNDVPFHIHISEQLKEVRDCEGFYGKRPVEWFLDNCEVNENFHLVHCTHLNDAEVKGIAKSKASVVLCPSTEGNLGDGIFRLMDYKKQGGRWSVGTDSHIGLNPFEELRILDYGQRLITHKRNIFTTADSGDSGFNSIEMCWRSGRRAMGLDDTEFFKTGAYFDAVVMKAHSPLAESSSLKNLCNTFIYASDVSDVLGTIVAGEWMVKEGVHRNRDTIKAAFHQTIRVLGSR